MDLQKEVLMMKKDIQKIKILLSSLEERLLSLEPKNLSHLVDANPSVIGSRQEKILFLKNISHSILEELKTKETCFRSTIYDLFCCELDYLKSDRDYIVPDPHVYVVLRRIFD